MQGDFLDRAAPRQGWTVPEGGAQTSRLPADARQSRECVPVSYPRTYDAPKQATY
jgi:hypothetical protein